MNDTATTMKRPAVFLDRDGTVNVEVHYLSQPEQIELLPTVSETISLLNSRGIPVVIVTNRYRPRLFSGTPPHRDSRSFTPDTGRKKRPDRWNLLLSTSSHRRFGRVSEGL